MYLRRMFMGGKLTYCVRFKVNVILDIKGMLGLRTSVSKRTHYGCETLEHFRKVCRIY